MNTRTLPPINLQVGQQVLRRDGLSGQVVFTTGELFEVLWDDGARYHYRANGRWCGSWGVDQCHLDLLCVGQPSYNAPDERPPADKLGTAIDYALVFGWGVFAGVVAGVILQHLWPL